MSKTSEDPDKEPATTEEEQKEEGMAIATGWVRVAVVSIFATVLTALGLLQATGMIDLFPFGEGWTVQWLVFVLIAVVLVAAEAWSWRSNRV